MEGYTTRALYEVIKLNLLMKDKDLIHFIRTMNENILEEFKKIKSNKLGVNEILNRYENYTIVFMMIKSVMKTAKISNFQDKVKDITDMLLNDLLEDKPVDNRKNKYEDED